VQGGPVFGFKNGLVIFPLISLSFQRYWLVFDFFTRFVRKAMRGFVLSHLSLFAKSH
jgi:hypothetical protein